MADFSELKTTNYNCINCKYKPECIYVITSEEIYSDNENRFIVKAFYSEEEAQQFIDDYKDRLLYRNLDYDRVDIH